MRDQSSELFALQGAAYRQQVLSAADRADSTVITTQARALMHDWLFNKIAEEYALSADWDDRWRTGGTLDEVLDEAHLSPRHLLAGLRRFARDRGERLRRLGEELSATAARPKALRRRKRSTSAARPGSGARTPPKRPRPGPGPRRSAGGRPVGRAAKSR